MKYHPTNKFLEKQRLETQAEFYESLVGREYTIQTLVDMHGISRPTVAKWLKEAKIEPIYGSWPYRFKLENSIDFDSSLKPNRIRAKDSPTILNSDFVINSDSAIAKYLEHLLTKETRVLDIVDQFRKIKSAEDAQLLIKSLTDVLATAQYYKLLLEEDGLI